MPGYTSGTLLDRKYYWRVSAMTANNEYGPYSAAKNFTIDTIAPLPPVLALPVNGRTTIGTQYFSWTPSKMASKYKFAYDTEADTIR